MRKCARILLVFMLFAFAFQCNAESRSTIDLKVFLSDADANGNINMHIYMSNNAESTILKNARIEIRPSGGLRIKSGSAYNALGDMDYYSQTNLYLTLTGEYGADMSVYVTASADNANTRVYKCEFETIPAARALVYGCERDNDGRMLNSVNWMRDIFKASYYDGLPVSVVSSYNENDFMEYIKVLKSWPTLDCDITYISINCHGGPGGALALSYAPGAPLIDMRELLNYISDNVKGRIVLIISACYSGVAAEVAHSASDDILSGIDTERFTILTSTDAEHMSPSFTGESGYSLFTRDIRDGISKRVADSDSNEVVTVSEMHAYLKKRAKGFTGQLAKIKGAYLIPTMFGDGEIRLYNYSADSYSERCVLAPERTTLDGVPYDQDRANTQFDIMFTYRIENGEAILEGYTGSADVVYVPEILGGYPVTTLDSYSSFYGATSLVLNEGMRTIRECACHSHHNLRDVYIPSSVTYIGDNAFGYVWVNSANYASQGAIDELYETVLNYRYGELGYLRLKIFTTIRSNAGGTAAERYASQNNIQFEILNTAP